MRDAMGKAAARPATMGKLRLRLRRGRRWAGSELRLLLVFVIRLYQASLSLVWGPSCRYTPTCSQYAVEAIERHGVVRGTALAVWRVLRCHPLARGGHDPVPPLPHEKGG